MIAFVDSAAVGNMSHFAKMSAKIIVYKESENNFLSLHITIDDNDSLSAVKYSQWIDGASHLRETEKRKPSRLIVKIVSDSEYSSSLNFDLCSKELTGAEQLTHRLLCYEENDFEDSFRSHSQYNPGNYRRCFYKSDEEKTRNKVIDSENFSPLEYSLARVKENNARIMENIRKLNRTLNYTKKKEILEKVCPKTRYPCVSCGKCFVYETGLKRHCYAQHSVSDNQPRWQVVWACHKCFQVWPRQDLALEHASKHTRPLPPTEECIREVKTSTLLQCEFCEKVYTSIPRLLRHTKAHTTVNNYECSQCVCFFQSFKAAEQHWLMCPWLKSCYNFLLPRMLVCNVCDRKFKNYEELYKHRYKLGHFIAKKYCNFKSSGVLAYQCEVCAQYFPSVGLLLYHKSQEHSHNDSD